MRLIDADKLKAEFDLITSKSATGECFSIPIKHMKQIIDNAPTVEPNKGNWIFQYKFLGDNFYKCSSCDRLLSIYVEQDIEQFLFCPNCGARMKGGAE